MLVDRRLAASIERQIASTETPSSFEPAALRRLDYGSALEADLAEAYSMNFEQDISGRGAGCRVQ